MPLLLTSNRAKLAVFVAPDTSSAKVGDLQGAGPFAVVDYRAEHPAADTDYAFVRLPGGPGGGWVCTRSRGTRYATVASPALALPAGVPESALVDQLALFRRYTYALQGTVYPKALLGNPRVRVAGPTPPRTTNCVTFVEALLVYAWQQERPGFTWNEHRHGQMMIFSLTDRFSPVTAVVEHGMGVAADERALPAPWSIAQGWRKNGGGHCFLVVDADPATDRVLILEANQAHRLNGVGFRKLGTLEANPNGPGATWMDRKEAPTWTKVRADYPELRVARLAVSDVSWVRGG